MLQVLLPVVSEMNPAGRSIQECHAQVVLEGGKPANHRRQRDIEVRGSCGEAASLHDAYKALDRSEFVQFDYSIFWSSLVQKGIFIQTFERVKLARSGVVRMLPSRDR